MNVRFAERVQAIQPSPTLAVSDRARALRQQGLDVVDLGGGDPDFATPKHICDAAAEALSRGETHYVAGAGIPPLREAIARKLRADNGIDVDPSAPRSLTPRRQPPPPRRSSELSPTPSPSPTPAPRTPARSPSRTRCPPA